MPTSPALRVAVRAHDLCYAHDGRDVLHDVSVTLPRGTVTAVAGANGAGKSTLVEILAGVRRPRRGSLERLGAVALVVQRPTAPDTLPVTVHDVVAMGTWARRRSSSPAPTAVDDAIERVGLRGLERRPLATLSGGQRQRALLAQGLVQRADVLLLDEPAAGLDAASRERTRFLLAEEAARGAAIACVTHDDADIDAADRVVRLEEGRLLGSSG
ncbi:ATP-binding cassette domain-containing protein [Nocardioides sp. BGMRC 2183]|nr:ATP-binding cassette domain-containing protein [Nocardioides sp. BGMRC 2183]